jgi:acylphosphatase
VKKSIMAKKQAKRWLISGRVQGVGFRYFVQKRSTELGLAGWVKNLDDGRVEVYAAGSPEKLAELSAALHAGPISSDVRTVEQRDDHVANVSGFRIT